jgi:hypothetical protein
MPIDPAPHIDWAERVGGSIAAAYRFPPHSADREDVRAYAVLVMVQKAKDYDPARLPPGGDHAKAFRGWCHPTLKSECVREAKRLRNGGTYHTRRDESAPVVAVTMSAIGGDLLAMEHAETGGRPGIHYADQVPDHRPPPEIDETPTPRPPVDAALPAIDTRITQLRAELDAYEVARRLLAELAPVCHHWPDVRKLVLAELDTRKAKAGSAA